MGHLNSYVEKDGNNNILSQSSGVTYDDIYRLTAYNVLYGTNTALTYGFTYLNNDLPSTTTFNGKTVSFTYDDGNKLTNQVNPNNTEDIFTYNDAKQIDGVQTDGVTVTTDPLGNPITTLTPKWTSSSSYNDPDGRLSIVSTSGLINNSANYTYNIGTEKLNRLSHSTIIDGTPGSGTTYNFDYTYDPAGNLLTMAVPNGSGVATNTFTYDSANELATIKVDNNPTTSVLYDTNGNLKQLTLNGKTYQYGYDASNRLVSVSDGTNTTSYTYGQDGQRLTKTTNGVTITYHYVNGQLAFETSSADASNPNLIHSLYVHSPQGKLLAVSLNYTIGGANNTYYFYHYNAQGDVVAVTKDNGSIYRQYLYDPYGNVISVKDGSGTAVDINNDAGFNNAYTYRGYRYDADTGLYYLNARYFGAGIGRFLTKDTFKGVDKNPQSLNRYAYAEGDPINLFDPTGYAADETGDPMHPYVSDDAGQFETGKLSFGNSRPKNKDIEGSQNGNDLFLSTTALSIDTIASAKVLAKVAGKGLIKAMGKSLPIFGATTLAYGLLEDWYSYNGNNMWYAMGLTLIGATLPVLGTAFIIGTLGATSMGLVFGTTTGIALTFIIPDLKNKWLKTRF